jgi:hypothetical protein
MEHSHDDSKKCSICLAPLSIEVYRLECSHEFHPPCLLQWFQRHPSCPMCRKEVENQEGQPEFLALDIYTPESNQEIPPPFHCSECIWGACHCMSALYVHILTVLGISMGNVLLPFPSNIVFMGLSSVILLYTYYRAGKRFAQRVYEERV